MSQQERSGLFTPDKDKEPENDTTH